MENKEKQFDVEFGKKIKALRKAENMSQMDLAKLLGYESTGAISQVENGIRGMKKEKVIEVAKVFGIDPGFLLVHDGITSENAKAIAAFHKCLKMPEDKRPATFAAIMQLLEGIEKN